MHMIIDVKHVRVLPHRNARRCAAQESTRGTHRKKGQGLCTGHAKPIVKTKFNPGASGVKVLAGIGHGKVLVWEYLDGSWGGEAAAAAYRGPIKTARATEYPGRKSFNVLEDNDPSGFKAGLGIAAKKEVGIKAFEIPKRSPCLNVCDYHVWAEVNKRMRQQEKKFPVGKRESRAAFVGTYASYCLGAPSFTGDSFCGRREAALCSPGGSQGWQHRGGWERQEVKCAACCRAIDSEGVHIHLE